MKKQRKITAILLIVAILVGYMMLKDSKTENHQQDTPKSTEISDTTNTPETTDAPTETTSQEKYLVVIDPGHQAKGNSEKEPLGPGSEVLKTKVSSGTAGRFTGIAEYELNLAVSLMLQELLEARGYEVVLVRTTHDVNISNAERAQMANDLYADIFVRIHANGNTDSRVNGILTICQTKENPYNGDMYENSYLLSKLVLDEMVKTTGANKQYVWETDTMTGINWSRVPVTIVEMGFMTNEAEDRKMATEEYRGLLAEGIANGIDQYFDAISGG